MSKQVTMTMYAHKAPEWYSAPFQLFQCDMSDHGYVLLGEVEVTFTAPTTDPVAAELESIDKAIAAVRSEFQGKLNELNELNELEERRDNLLAITHQ